jgi:carbonic anhydrase
MTRTDLNRRALLGGGCGCAAAAAAAGAAGLGVAPAARAAGTERTGPTPDEALARLAEGNRRFVAEAPQRAAQGRERRLAIAAAQHPFAVLVGCSDSRVPPELVFGCGLGELFVVRAAGNTVDRAALGSIGYAVAELGVPLVVVLGHERCGAVAAAVEVAKHDAALPAAIGELVAPIIPAVLKVQGAKGDLLDNAVRENVRRVVEGVRRATDPILSAPLTSGRLKVVGACYDLEDGTVEFLEESWTWRRPQDPSGPGRGSAPPVLGSLGQGPSSTAATGPDALTR